jgi:SpoVK/Ycf46/Vps4 family AAA+-type ATPase
VKIVPRFHWQHLILPPDPLQQLHEIADRLQYAIRVYEEWGFEGGIANARGLTVLFAGQSGTGKTLAAEVIANEIGLELFKIDLSSVVSKYIGETEKNLATIFDEATQSNAILFFDEADALFGKRTEVSDSHDRYANIEVGYLLQRLETYDGVGILATNFRQNIDEAFTRRMDFVVDFPFPDEVYRAQIWQVCYPPNAPLGRSVNFETLADRYRLSGGNIRNAALASAFIAAAEQSPAIEMSHIFKAIRREYQKMGKLMEDEFFSNTR